MTKLATDLPEPKKLTEDDLIKLDEEARQWVKAVTKGTASLERLTPDDLKIIIR